MPMSCDTVSIFQPFEATEPIFVIEVREVTPSRFAVTVFVRDANDQFERSTSVCYFVTMTMEQILETFPTAQILKSSKD